MVLVRKLTILLKSLFHFHSCCPDQPLQTSCFLYHISCSPSWIVSAHCCFDSLRRPHLHLAKVLHPLPPAPDTLPIVHTTFLQLLCNLLPPTCTTSSTRQLLSEAACTCIQHLPPLIWGRHSWPFIQHLSQGTSLSSVDTMTSAFFGTRVWSVLVLFGLPLVGLRLDIAGAAISLPLHSFTLSSSAVMSSSLG